MSRLLVAVGTSSLVILVSVLITGGFTIHAGALFLSAIGVYVLLHQVVVQRTTEIGVRMALGATPGAVEALLLRQGLTLALFGAGIGVVGAWSVCRLASKLLYEIAPTDPATFAISVLVLIVVAGVACWIPSHGAARIDPMLALRQE